jgi:hypothetical protein
MIAAAGQVSWCWTDSSSRGGSGPSLQQRSVWRRWRLEQGAAATLTLGERFAAQRAPQQGRLLSHDVSSSRSVWHRCVAASERLKRPRCLSIGTSMSHSRKPGTRAVAGRVGATTVRRYARDDLGSRGRWQQSWEGSASANAREAPAPPALHLPAGADCNIPVTPASHRFGLR